MKPRSAEELSPKSIDVNLRPIHSTFLRVCEIRPRINKKRRSFRKHDAERAVPAKLMFECEIKNDYLPEMPFAFYRQERHKRIGKTKLQMQSLFSALNAAHRLLRSTDEMLYITLDFVDFVSCQ